MVALVTIAAHNHQLDIKNPLYAISLGQKRCKHTFEWNGHKYDFFFLRTAPADCFLGDPGVCMLLSLRSQQPRALMSNGSW